MSSIVGKNQTVTPLPPQKLSPAEQKKLNQEFQEALKLMDQLEKPISFEDRYFHRPSPEDKTNDRNQIVVPPPKPGEPKPL